MGALVLGRVTAPLDGPRGPAGAFKISVPPQWLAEGATVEFELPRNLGCAACHGGGCAECEYSGAITVRGRKELSEFVEVTLPVTDIDDAPPSVSSRGVLIRMPERGGFASEPDVPRGHLMLSVLAGELMEGVQRVEEEAPPAEPVAEPVDGPVADLAPGRTPAWLKILAFVVVLYLIALISLRIFGVS